MIVPCNCCMLFELSGYRGPCTTILNTGKHFQSVFCRSLLDKKNEYGYKMIQSDLKKYTAL
jgi:hypothetical protein